MFELIDTHPISYILIYFDYNYKYNKIKTSIIKVQLLYIKTKQYFILSKKGK